MMWLALLAGSAQAAAPPSPALSVAPFETTVATKVEIDLVFDDAGKPRSCRVRDTSPSPTAEAKLCADILAGKVPISPPPKAGATTDGASAASARLLNMGDVFTSEDYPLEALKNAEQGTPSVSVTVDQAGRPTACRISESSGSPSLDSTSCALLMQRGRFKISPDAPAGATAHVATVRVRWSLPEGNGVPFADYAMRTIFAIDHDMTLGSCRLEGMIHPSEASDQCAFKRPVAVNIIQFGLTGLPAANRELVMEQGFVVGAADSARSIGTGRGMHVIWRTAWSLAIDADGKVKECEPVEFDEGDDDAEATQRMCAKNKQLPFQPLPPGQVDRSLRYAVLYYVNFLRPRSGASPDR